MPTNSNNSSMLTTEVFGKNLIAYNSKRRHIINQGGARSSKPTPSFSFYT
jgi:hypothetical protein